MRCAGHRKAARSREMPLLRTPRLALSKLGGRVTRTMPRRCVGTARTADQGNADAQSAIGALYQNGLRRVPDIMARRCAGTARPPIRDMPMLRTTSARYIKTVRTCPELCEADALVPQGRRPGTCRCSGQHRLALSNGSGVSQNYGEAMRWYRKAADQEMPLLRTSSALYQTGSGVSQDYGEAMALVPQGRRPGNAVAQNASARSIKTVGRVSQTMRGDDAGTARPPIREIPLLRTTSARLSRNGWWRVPELSPRRCAGTARPPTGSAVAKGRIAAASRTSSHLMTISHNIVIGLLPMGNQGLAR